MKRLIFLAVLIPGLFSLSWTQSNIDEKIKEFKKFIAANPNDAVAHYNLAGVYYNSEVYGLAIKHLDKAQELGYPVTPSILEALEPYR